jgi:molybdopterin-guanine dinucleotide biosynthesis protein A
VALETQALCALETVKTVQTGTGPAYMFAPGHCPCVSICLPSVACAAAHRSTCCLLPAPYTPQLHTEFSFFNHSCVPNCINWVLPGQPRAMVVRAAAHIPAGAQATISYLGAPQLLPLSGRQQALGNFGFTCR